MTRVLRVGGLNNANEETKTAINQKFNNTEFLLEFVGSQSADVFVVDSLFLPELVSSKKVVELDSVEGVFSFAAEAGKVEGKVYGIPQTVSSQFLFYPTSEQAKYSGVKTIYDVVKQGRLVYPKVSEQITVAVNYYAATGSIPAKATDVSQDFVTGYRVVVDGTEIETVDEYFQNNQGGALVASTQDVANRNGTESTLEVASLAAASGKKLYFANVVVVSADVSEEKKAAAKQLASIIASTTNGYELPANKSALETAANSNVLLKKVAAVISQDEANAEVFRFTTNEAGAANTGKLILPSIQHSAVATIRTLSADVVQKANSGHPGMPIGMAAIGYTLWSQFYNSAPKETRWINRDRFVLSNGHGCVLQYVLLHLAGFDVTLDDLKNFRQLDSKTPGHPEFGWTSGIDATTGPLGQGVANLVGMALAQKHLSAKFSTPDFDLLNHHVFGFCSDGDLMEGVALEAIAQAGHHKLNNLTLIYDDNKITIDGNTSLAMTENVNEILQGYGWHTQIVEQGDADLVGMKQAILNALAVTDRPSMILLRTTIGYSTVKQNTSGVHGSPLGSDGIKNLKQLTGFNPNESFVIPEAVLAKTRQIGERGNAKYDEWQKLFSQYQQQNPEKAKKFEDFIHQRLPADWDKCLPDFSKKGDMATRQCSSVVLNAIAPVVENLVGGSADLTPSTLTFLDISKDCQPDSRDGRHFRFGVREHSMISIGNGMCYYGGLRPYVSTFLIFGGYGLGAIRLGALTHLPLTYVFTHDSIGLGEDGPTHQPVEMLPLLRCIPNLVLFRPADGTETNAAYKYAIESTKRPTALALTRQKTPFLARSTIQDALKGGYTVFSNGEFDKPDIIFVASGSEVGISIDAAKLLTDVKVSVVSMPSWELFDEQDIEYRKSILIPGVPVLSVEASSTQGWSRYAHAFAGLTTFGASGPFEQVYEKFGLTDRQLAERARKITQVYNASSPAPLQSAIAPEL